MVYDGIRRTTFDASLASFQSRGMMVSIGASSGFPEPVSVATLNQKSLFLTRPSLAAYISDTAEYRKRALDVLDAVLRGVIKPSVWKSFPLAEAAAAHQALESGASKGTILVKP